MTENYLQVFMRFYNEDLSSISDYIKHSKKSITTAQDELDKKLTKVVGGEQVLLIGLDDRDEHSKIHQVFPHFFRLSTFVGLYSYFENKLTRLCDAFQEKKNFTLKSSDLSGENLIERSKRYLRLVAQLDLDSLNNEWMKIKDYQKLRNCFTHNGSNIIREKLKDLKDQSLFPIVKAFSHLDLSPYGIVYISNDDFLFEFIDVQKTYMSKLVGIADIKFRK